MHRRPDAQRVVELEAENRELAPELRELPRANEILKRDAVRPRTGLSLLSICVLVGACGGDTSEPQRFAPAASLPETQAIPPGDPPTVTDLGGSELLLLTRSGCVDGTVPCPVLVAGGVRYAETGQSIRPVAPTLLGDAVASTDDGSDVLYRVFNDDTLLVRLSGSDATVVVAEWAELSPAFVRRWCSLVPDGGALADCDAVAVRPNSPEV